MISHLALLVAQAAFCGGVLLALFYHRRRLGLGPLYLVLGTLQFAQFVLAVAIRVEIAPSFLVSPATAVLFPLTVLMVLLTYVEEDAETTRTLAYGIVICNLTLYAVTSVSGLHLRLPGHENVLGLPGDGRALPMRVVFASTVSTVADMVAAIVLFEFLSRHLPRLLLARLWLTAAAVMVLDSVLFTTLAFAPSPAYAAVLLSGLAAKLLGATFYAALTAWYVRRFERAGDGEGHGPDDVFSWLTYRQRYEQARTLMARDALTGLYNRGYFDEVAPRQIAHAQRARHEMSLVLLDIDRLKDANDRYGHQAGDDLVRFVAGEIRQMVRAADAACRYGGDEFVVILSNADHAAAGIFGERLVRNVRERSVLREPVARWAPASISLGIATYPADGTTLDALIAAADARLYERKGRRTADQPVS